MCGGCWALVRTRAGGVERLGKALAAGGFDEYAGLARAFGQIFDAPIGAVTDAPRLADH